MKHLKNNTRADLRARTRFCHRLPSKRLLGWIALQALCVLDLASCTTAIGARKTVPAVAYRQTHENAVSRAEPSRDSLSVLHRFAKQEEFETAPETTLRWIHDQAVQSGERGLIFALSELNYLAGERIRHGVKPWDRRDPRDYYLASAVYAWFFLCGEPTETLPDPFDQRFRTACDLYNNGLAWALSQRKGTNALATLAGGMRNLPVGRLEVQFDPTGFPWPLEDFKEFVLAQQYLVRGLSLRNIRPGLGATLVAVTRQTENTGLSRSVPATAFLRVNGQLADLGKGECSASLELYSAFDTRSVKVGERSIPLETDTTVPIAYGLNQPLVWRLGMMQFLSFREHVRSDVYLMQPYQKGKIPVIFVHGTFSSPIWWAEMLNTLSGDPQLQKHLQFGYFIYNSGNPTSLSALKLREALQAKIKELDPEGKDPALRRMVVIGHSQGGLLTKLTATDTGDTLLNSVLKTNRLGNEALTPKQEALLRRYLCFEPLPFVKRVVFISTPHRGSYLAGSFARRVARKLVTLPSRMIERSKEFAGLSDKLEIPEEFRGNSTSLDSMSPRNPVQLALADLPLAPGVRGHSIIAVKGSGDYTKGKDGLVAYDSAHVDYVESEFIVRGPHSCQSLPPTIEEVRRILREHISELAASETQPAAQRP